MRMISREEWSRMILEAKAPFYYYNYVQSSADNLIGVVNGFTGDVLYFNFVSKSYKPKPRDLEDLSKAYRVGKRDL